MDEKNFSFFLFCGKTLITEGNINNILYFKQN